MKTDSQPPRPKADSSPSTGEVRVGDRYHRHDKRATVEVVRVTDTHVEWEVAYDGDSWRFIEIHEKFSEMEANSLKWGAVFEPAPTEKGQ
jgi:hypothetical protein